MANLCNRCGQPLPRQDSRFCNRCGAGISPNASSSPIPRRTQVIAGQYAPPAPGTEGGNARPILREQIAFTSSSSSAPPSAPGDAPPWLNRLDRNGASPASSLPLEKSLPDTPPGIVNPPSNAGRPSSPAASRLTQRELRIKVWDGKEAGSPNSDAPDFQPSDHTALFSNDQQEKPAQVPPVPLHQQTEESSEVVDMPTVPVPSAFAGEKNEHSFPPATRREQTVSDNAHTSEGDREDADLPTRPMPAHLSVPAQLHAQRSSDRRFPAQSYRQAVPPQSSPGQMKDQQQQAFSAPVGPGQAQIRQQSVMPSSPFSSPGFQQPVAMQAPAIDERAVRPAPAAPRRRKSKFRLLVALVMLLILLVGGLIYWLVAYQPFSVPAVTSTSLSFRNANLGIALQYPQGWTSRLDSAHQTASFFDGNRVDQLTISVSSSNGASATTYASKEAARLGLTAQKNLTPITFAGTTWQRVQGTLLVSGASDIETVLVAQHANHFYTMTQIAPAATYAGADGLFFSIFRSSFQFL